MPFRIGGKLTGRSGEDGAAAARVTAQPHALMAQLKIYVATSYCVTEVPDLSRPDPDRIVIYRIFLLLQCQTPNRDRGRGGRESWRSPECIYVQKVPRNTLYADIDEEGLSGKPRVA